MEEWKVYKIIHFKNKGDRIYEVSNYGNVRLNDILIDLSKYKHQRYYHIGTFKVHRAVAELFVPNPNNYNEVDHKNGDPHDNRAENLQWCTHEMNLNNPITRKRNSEAQKIIREQTKWKEHQSASQKIEKKDHVWLCNGYDTVFPKKDKADYYLSKGYHYGRK